MTWAAPGRVNLIGEHVDYAGGLCLPFAIGQRTVVEAAPLPGDQVVLTSDAEPHGWTGTLDAIGPGRPDGWAGYAAGVLWALRAAGHPIGGLEVHVTESVPLGAGLSSSAALEAAVGLAACSIHGVDVSRTELAAACVRAENEIVGAQTGGMDQACVLLARAGHALLLDTRDGSTRHVPFAPAADGLAVLVIDTKVRHALADGQYGKRRAAVEAAALTLGVPSLRDLSVDDLRGLDADLLPRARHVVTEIARVRDVVARLDAGRLADIGPHLDASHASLRDDYEVSCAELDLAVDAARDAGALGARMTGGGFGGSAIALVPLDRADAVADGVRVAFARAGLAPPDVRTATPSAGAGRVDRTLTIQP